MKKTVAMEAPTHERLRQGRIRLMGAIGSEMDFEDVLNWLMDSVGWPKAKGK